MVFTSLHELQSMPKTVGIAAKIQGFSVSHWIRKIGPGSLDIAGLIPNPQKTRFPTFFAMCWAKFPVLCFRWVQSCHQRASSCTILDVTWTSMCITIGCNLRSIRGGVGSKPQLWTMLGPYATCANYIQITTIPCTFLAACSVRKCRPPAETIQVEQIVVTGLIGS